MNTKPTSAANSIDLRVTLLYAFFGGLWILLSDRLLAVFMTDIPALSMMQTYKGWAFVLCSALLIYSLLRRELKLREIAENECYKSEERYRLIAEHAEDMIWTMNMNLQLTYVSPSVERALGYSAQEILASTPEKFLTPDSYAAGVKIFNEEANRAQPRPNPNYARMIELEYRRKDDSTFWVEMKFSFFRAANGRPIAVLGVGRDVTERKQAEDILRKSDDRFRQMFQSHSAVMLLVDPNSGAIIDANLAAVRFYGYPKEKLVHMFIDAINMISPQQIAEAREQTKNKQRDRWLFPHRLADGQIRMVEVRSSPVDINGQPLLFSIIEDVTEHQQALEQLEILKHSIEMASDSAYWLDTDGQFTYVNHAGCRDLGYTREELLKMRIGDINPLATGEKWNQVWQQLRKNKFYLSESIHRRKDGSKFPVEITSTYIQFGGREYCNGFAKDITERKQAEEALRESEQRFRTLIEQSSEGITLISEEGNILEWNRAMEQISGFSREQAVGQPVWEVQIQLIPSEHRSPQAAELAKRSFMTVLQTGEIPFGNHLDVKIQTPGGERKIVTQTIFVIKTAGGYRIGSIVLDITKRKQIEEELRSLNDQLEQRVADRTAELNHTNIELERANRVKDEFLANMSHELRTPLNSILGLSESLLEERFGTLNNYQHKSLQIMEASGHHLLELINDILDLSKLEAGKFDYYPQVISVDEICRASLAFVKSQAAKKSITVTYTNEASVLQIFADARRLKQILVNLLTNAVKFTLENGHVTLQVDCEPLEERIRFSVIDDGIGIAAKDLQRLFQRFVQVDSSLNRQYEGTGLGLAIVQKLTDLHGGSVHVESDGVPGKGSRFTIILSCNQDNIVKPEQPKPNRGLENPKPVKTVSTISDASVARRVILLAEDNMSNILTVSEYLESYGYEIVVAHDGLEAIAKTEEISPDMILMDIQMPSMNGLEAMTRLRKDDRFASTPIIALTALAMPGDRERCLNAGANEYMSKPVSLKSLRETIENLMRA